MPLLLFIGLSARRMRRCLCFSDASGSVCVSGQMRNRWRSGNRCSIPWTWQYGTDPSQNSTSATAHLNRHSVDSVRDVCSQSIVIRSMWYHSRIPTSIRLHPWALFITKHIYHFDTDCIQRDIRNTSGSLQKFIWFIIYTFPKFDENPPITVWVFLLTYRQTNTGQSITFPPTRGECNELMSVRVHIELK